MEILLDKMLRWMGLRDLPESRLESVDPLVWTRAEDIYPAGTGPDDRERQVVVQVRGTTLKVFNLVSTPNGARQTADYGLEGVLVPKGRYLSHIFVRNLFYNQDPKSRIFNPREMEAGPDLTENHVHALSVAFGNAIRGQKAIGTEGNILQMDPPVPGNIIYLPSARVPQRVCRA